jgi:hypothetical protein
MGPVYNRIDRRIVFRIDWLLGLRVHLCDVAFDRLQPTVAKDLGGVESTGIQVMSDPLGRGRFGFTFLEAPPRLPHGFGSDPR